MIGDRWTVRLEESRNERFWRGGLLVFGSLVSAALAALLLRRVDVSAAWERVVDIEPSLLLLPAMVAFANLSLRALRWWMIFPVQARLGAGRTFFAFATGSLANHFLPGRGGDLMRCYLATRGTLTERMGLGLCTLVVEKIFDTLCLLVLVSTAGLLLSPPAWYEKMQVAVLLVVAMALLLLILVWWNAEVFADRAGRILHHLRLPRVAEHAVAFISRFASGLQVVTSISRLCLLAGCTGVIWLFEGLVIWGLAQALGVGLSFAGCVLVGAVMGLSRAIPAAPGHIGSYEFFMVTATGLLGVTAEQGLALGLVTHAGVLLFAIAFGVVGALATSTSISGLRRITSPLADTDPQQQSRKLA